MAGLLSGTESFTLQEPSDLCTEQLGCTFLLSIIMTNSNNSSKVKWSSELAGSIRWTFCSCFQVHRDYFTHLSPHNLLFCRAGWGAEMQDYPVSRQQASLRLCKPLQCTRGEAGTGTSPDFMECGIDRAFIKAESKTSCQTTFCQWKHVPRSLWGCLLSQHCSLGRCKLYCDLFFSFSVLWMFPPLLTAGIFQIYQLPIGSGLNSWSHVLARENLPVSWLMDMHPHHQTSEMVCGKKRSVENRWSMHPYIHKKSFISKGINF